MTVTQDFTYQFTDTGVILNTDVVTTDPFVDVDKISGLDSAPVRESDRVREGMDGGFMDSQYEDMRVVVIEGTIYSPQSQVDTFLDTLKGNFSPTLLNYPFYFQHPNIGVRTIFAKSLGVRYDIDTLRRTGKCSVQIQLKAEDPSIYGPEIVISAGLAAPSSGRGYNKSYNYGYGITLGSSGALVCNNIGNKPAKASFHLVNVVNPTIVSDTTNNLLEFNISIQGSDFIDVDLRNRTVLLNGTANRRGTLTGGSRWFLLQPGINNVRLLGTALVGTPQLTATFRPAYR